MLQNKVKSGSAPSPVPNGEDIKPSQESAETPIFTKPKRKLRKIVISVMVIGLAAAVAAYFLLGNRGQQAANTISYINHTVEARDIVLNLSGTGTLNPANSYTVTTLISGDILNAPFEEGDMVEKDTVLFEVDSSDTASSIEQAEISLAQSQRGYAQKVKSLEDLHIKANESGTVIEMSVKEGDKVSSGQKIAQIRNNATMSLVIPFGTDDAAGFYVGQDAEVTLDGTFERMSGTISEISPIEERLEGNMLVRKVTIDVANPGGIAVDSVATAMVGDIACNGSGAFSYKAESTVTAGTSGEVAAIHAGTGTTVSKNQVLVTLTSDSLSNDVQNSADSLHNSQISLQNKYDQLDAYTIKSPIAGTIIEKSYKAGDTLESGKTLCTIFDLSYLTMTLNVDELDVSKVKEDQEVTITAEAIPGQSYKGIVTKVNINGTTSSGVTSYPVTIRIDETEGLLPGMNVQASIIVSETSDAVAIPVSALVRGNRVLVKSASAGNVPAEMAATLPEGFTYVQVTPGISDDDYIEIRDGLSVGDVIAYADAVVPEASQNGFAPGGIGVMGGAGGRPQGGGTFPSGGSQGGAVPGGQGGGQGARPGGAGGN